MSSNSPGEIVAAARTYHRTDVVRASWWNVPFETALERLSFSTMRDERRADGRHPAVKIQIPSVEPEEETEEDERDRPSFWCPRVQDDIITAQPTLTAEPSYPEWEDLDVPSSYEKRTVPTKRTKRLTVVQTGVFYFFSCSSCRGARGQQQVREMARSANEKVKHMWKSEIENKPITMTRKGNIIEVDGTKASDIALILPPSTMISGGVQIPDSERQHRHHLIIKGIDEILEDLKPLTKGKNTFKWRVKRVDDYVQPPFEDTAKNFDLPGQEHEKREMQWAMLPPPPPVLKAPHGKGPRLADYDDESDTIFASSSKSAGGSLNRSSVTLQRGRGNTNSTMMTISTTGLPIIEGQGPEVVDVSRIEGLPMLPPPVVLSDGDDFLMSPNTLQEILSGNVSPDSGAYESGMSPLYKSHKSIAFESGTTTTTFKVPSWRMSATSFDNRKYMMDGPKDMSYSPRYTGSFDGLDGLADLDKKFADVRMNPRSPVSSVMSFSSDIAGVKAMIRSNSDFEDKHIMRTASPRISEIAANR